MKDLAWIDHLAALSHLSFEGAEKEKMAADMESIMRLMDTVTAWDPPKEDLIAADGGMELLREDSLGESLSAEELLSNAKQKSHPYFEVQKLID